MRLHLTLGVLLQLGAGVAAAQSAGPRQDALVAFDSWHSPAPAAASRAVRLRDPDELRSDRTRRILIGGAIGAAAGVVACTAISTLANDSAEGGLSFCPLDTYLLIGGGGFVAGAAIAWLL